VNTSCSVSDDSGKVIVDSIHGDIHLNPREVDVIDTPSFQRLRHLKQLAMAQLVYPSATHTRFAHSIGALGTMIRILGAARHNKVDLSGEESEDLRLAALLHDIGHYPYSHLMEKIDEVTLTEEVVEGAAPTQKAIDARKTDYPDHEEVGTLIVTSQSDLTNAIGGKERAKKVADLFTRSTAGDPQLSKLIHSSLDLDRLDYLLRDSHATGVPYGHVDINYLLNNLKVSAEKVVGFRDKALPAVEHLLLARFFMHRVVYYHKTIFGMEETCRQLLRRVRDRDDNRYGLPVDGEEIKKLVTSNALHSFTDAFVDNVIRQATDDEDHVIGALATAVQARRPPLFIKEVQVCEETEQQYHAGAAFQRNCKSRLRSLAQEFHIPLGQFLLCGPKITVIKPPRHSRASEMAHLKPEEINIRVSEEEEADVKVFEDGTAEPRSFVDIRHSLIAKYAKYSLQMSRLYVVYDGSDRIDVRGRLRDRVKDWDTA
jgi:HD superfamily phosphohydrolase